MQRHQHSITAILLFCALLAAAGSAEARGRGRSKGLSGTYTGTIVSVSTHSINVDIGTDRRKTVSIQLNDKTTVSNGGKQGTIADLAKGQKVSIKVTKNKAVSITVTR